MLSLGTSPGERDETMLRAEGQRERQEMSKNQGGKDREGIHGEKEKNEERDKGVESRDDQCSLVSSQGNKQPFKETGTQFQPGQLKKTSTTFLPELFISNTTLY